MGVTEESFKNVFISDGGNGITLYKRTAGGGLGTRLATFKHEDYDVKITFKPKPRPVVKGDSVQVYSETGGPYTVLAVYADPDGYAGDAWAWLYRKGDMYPRSVYVSNLRHADSI